MSHCRLAVPYTAGVLGCGESPSRRRTLALAMTSSFALADERVVYPDLHRDANLVQSSTIHRQPHRLACGVERPCFGDVA